MKQNDLRALATHVANSNGELNAGSGNGVSVNGSTWNTNITGPSTQLAVDVWQGIVAGRWLLVDYFQADGRLYIVARRRTNDSASVLSVREQQVVVQAIRGRSNKEIAFHLGIAEATAATYLRRALGKLGVNSRTELIQIIPSVAFSYIPAPPPPDR